MSKFKFSTLTLACAGIFLTNTGTMAAQWTPVYGDVGTGAGVIAIGQASTAAGNETVVIGKNATASEDMSTVVGGFSTTERAGTALGYMASAGNTGVAIGRNASSAGASTAVAIGSSSSAVVEGSVALGANSAADRAGGAVDAVSFTGGTKSGLAWVSNKGAASIGSSSVTRQLMGVAAGSADTDAVNVAQLKDLKAYGDATFSTASNTVFGSNTSTEITPPTTPGGTDGVNAQNAAILGNNAKVLADGAVAIGVDSIAQSRIDASGTLPTGYLMPSSGVTDASVWQGDVNHGVVSFGGSYDDGQGNTVNFNRQITGVAAGSEDNDAVNVAQLKEVNNQVQGLVSGQTKVSQIDLLADPGDPANGVPATGIGLRFEAASTSGGSGAANGIGRLAYTDTNGDRRQVATMNDGFMVSGGNTGTTASDGSTVAPVKVDLNQGISFLGDEYLQTTVTAGDNGGAKVTIGASQALKDFLASSGVQPSEPTNPSNPGNSGNTGGTWTPNAAQQAALNGNFANGITVAPGEGNQAIQIKQGNVDMGGNRIQNVGNPINDGDAANKAYVDSTSRSLRNKINDVDKDLRAGVAMAMAVGNLPQAYMPGKSIVGLSAGTYHGQGGFALGLSHATENRQWILKGAASVDTRGNFGGTLSAGYQF